MTARHLAGCRLHALARRLVDEDVLRHIIEPTLSDLQHELCSTTGGWPGRIRARWAGYAAFWKVLALELISGRWPMSGRTIGRMAGIALLALCGYVLGLRVLPLALGGAWLRPGLRSAFQFYFTVQGLAAMMPFAVFATVLWAARTSRLMQQPIQARTYILFTLAAAVIARAVIIWLVPPAQSAYLRAMHMSAAPWPPAWPVLVLSWVRSPFGCAVYAALAVSLARYAKRGLMFGLMLVFVPLAALVLDGIAQQVALRTFGGRAMPVLSSFALNWGVYLVVLCLSALMMARSRLSRTAAA